MNDKQWYFEVHTPNVGVGSRLHWAVLDTLAAVKAEMRQHPGMIYRVTVPVGASAADRAEFARMDIQRL